MEQWPGYPCDNFWERFSAGVYKTVGGRFEIKRRGPKNWWLLDTLTGQRRRFDTLRGAQSYADKLKEILPTPRDDGRTPSTETNREARAASGKSVINEIASLFGRLPKKRVKIVWGVFSSTNQLVATYDYPRRSEAEAHAAQLRRERNATFFVQQVKEFMD